MASLPVQLSFINQSVLNTRKFPPILIKEVVTIGFFKTLFTYRDLASDPPNYVKMSL